MIRTNTVKSISLLLLIFIILIGFTTTVSASSSMDSKADIVMIAGDLEFSQVPSLKFSINSNKPVPLGTDSAGGYHFEYQADGEVLNTFVIEDARVSGKNWVLKVGLGEISNSTDPNDKIKNVKIKMGAPTAVIQGATNNDFYGYPVELVSSSDIYSTIATSKTGAFKIAMWEGKIPAASIKFPYSKRLLDQSNTYKADLLWSIEDAP